MKHTWGMSLLICGLAIALAASGESLAARKAAKESSDSKRTIAARPALPYANPVHAVRPPTSTEAPSSKAKRHRSMKVVKKSVPKAVVQPRTDLIHYGMLENPQRYDPRPAADSAGVLHPQAVDLTHDHFQELDRNQDGRIDPVERAFGRIDMDRDLHTRTLQ
jgi:hypothetical protein